MTEEVRRVDPNRRAGGGEYPTQDGFGWTNGVALALGARERAERARGGAALTAAGGAVLHKGANGFQFPRTHPARPPCRSEDA
jgi:hypothetical protein